ncbi:MAG: peptidoglycan-binding protein [Nitrospirales bacterium]|nr:MAG: peptidoglycan-binding protein [Nitrospirales bacterium]
MKSEEKKLEILIGTLKGNKAKFDASNSIIVALNPSNYSIEKSANYTDSKIPGLDSPVTQYASGNAKTLKLELLVDTYTFDKKQDIREAYIDRFEKLIEVDGEIHAPPPCKVVWGTMEFVGFLQSIQKTYVMFLGDGTPVRARLNLQFKEYNPVDIQLKKTKRHSPDKRRHHIVKDGDSLWQLAYQAYGDSRQWRVLADENNIDDPNILHPGDVLTIPSLTVTPLVKDR